MAVAVMLGFMSHLLLDEICSVVWSVQLLDSSLQGLGRFTVSGILKHEHDCFAKPGRV